jgi:hypothetical protein
MAILMSVAVKVDKKSRFKLTTNDLVDNEDCCMSTDNKLGFKVDIVARCCVDRAPFLST